MADPVTTKPSLTNTELTANKTLDNHETETESQRDRPPWIVLAAYLGMATIVLIFLAGSIASTRVLFTELLVAAAAIGVGALVGFLFGMPRAPNASADDDSSGSEGQVRYRPSNNLEQVSDWLTKLLIGVGLVEVRQLGSVLNRIGVAVDQSLSGSVAGTNVITQVVIVIFVLLGFICSFLWTRIYYARLQTLADSEIISSLREKVGLYRRKFVEEEKDKNKAVSVAQALATGEIPSATPKPTEEAAGVEAVDAIALPTEIQQKLREFENSPSEWDRDTAAEIFGQAEQEANGRKFEAEISFDLGTTLVINLRVRRLKGEPLVGPVIFCLHPTFNNPVVRVGAKGNLAETEISSAGWFTVIAIFDGGKTILSYDLRKLPNVPEWFVKGD